MGEPIRADYGRHMFVALQDMVWGTWGECGPETPVSDWFLDGATVGAPVQAAHIGLLRSLVRSLEVAGTGIASQFRVDRGPRVGGLPTRGRVAFPPASRRGPPSIRTSR